MGCKTLDEYRCVCLNKVLGCSAVAVDLYGEAFPRSQRENRAQTLFTAFDHMNELLVDPLYLRKLLQIFIIESIKQLNGDPNKVGAIGFCFGGACALEVGFHYDCLDKSSANVW